MDTMQIMQITRQQRRAILRSANESQANISIDIIRGVAVAPRTVGESYHYTTQTGMPIYHPSAYRRCGWSSMVYVPSTRRVMVGEQWLAQA
jgi:hypothetical protein